MRLRLIRLRFRRRLRKGQQQVEDFGQQAEQQIEQHLFKRFSRLVHVRRFVLAWLTLMTLIIVVLMAQNILLSDYFQTLQPVAGGIYTEGVVGTFSTANPLYATNDVDTTVSRLMFAGLFKYNDQNQLIGDLASSYTTDDKGLTYTVHLKPNLQWQDGQPLTSADVVFTYQMIQNPDAQSPLQSNWRGISVTAPDPHTVVFSLPDPLAAFPYNLTNGIVPQHLLANVTPSELRSVDFNTVHPVGAGPFAWQAIEVKGNDPVEAQEQIALTPFNNYQAGKPKLQQFVVHAYADPKQLAADFKAKKLNGAEGADNAIQPLLKKSGVQAHDLLLSAENMVFFKNSNPLFADIKLRQALVQSSNVPEIASQLGYATTLVREPLLKGQLAYDPKYQQSSFDLSAAKTTLANAGWTSGKDGTLTKNGQKLSFTLTVADKPEDRRVAQSLQQQWARAGVKVELQYLGNEDFQTALSEHNYDAILHSIAIGVDPDVFVYWDSSQADVRSANRLNLSEYKNSTADASLEAGRTRINPAIRTIKYKPFLQVWQQDAPALGLYQPRFLYVTNGNLAGLNDHVINSATDRFNNVENWEIREAKVTD